MPTVPPVSVELSYRVEFFGQLPALQARARTFLGGLGFDTRSQWCVLIALAEAVTNVLKFAGSGTVQLRWVETSDPHVLLEVFDDGPGIEDLENAVKDFHSEGVDWRTEPMILNRRGNGTGLGCIRRMLDTLEMENRVEGGLRLRGRKYLHTPPES